MWLKQEDEPHQEYAILEETTGTTLKKSLHFKSHLIKVILETAKFYPLAMLTYYQIHRPTTTKKYWT